MSASVQQQSLPILVIEPNWDTQITALNVPKIKFTFDITFPANFSFNFDLKCCEDKFSRFEYISISEITGVAIAALVQIGDIILKVNDTNMIETFEESQSLGPNMAKSKSMGATIHDKLKFINDSKSASRVVRFLRCPDLKPSKVLLQLFLDDAKVSSKFLAQSTGDGSQINTLQVLYSDPNVHSIVKKLMQGQKINWEIKGSSSLTNGGVVNTNMTQAAGNINMLTSYGGSMFGSMITSQEVGKWHQINNPQTGIMKEGIIKDPRNKWLAYTQQPLANIKQDSDGYFVYKVPTPIETPTSDLLEQSLSSKQTVVTDTMSKTITSSNELATSKTQPSGPVSLTLSFPSRKRLRESVKESSEISTTLTTENTTVVTNTIETNESVRDINQKPALTKIKFENDYVSDEFNNETNDKVSNTNIINKFKAKVNNIGQRTVTLCLGKFTTENDAQKAYKKALEEIKVTGKYSTKRPTNYPWDRVLPPVLLPTAAVSSTTSTPSTPAIPTLNLPSSSSGNTTSQSKLSATSAPPPLTQQQLLAASKAIKSPGPTSVTKPPVPSSQTSSARSVGHTDAVSDGGVYSGNKAMGGIAYQNLSTASLFPSSSSYQHSQPASARSDLSNISMGMPSSQYSSQTQQQIDQQDSTNKSGATSSKIVTSARKKTPSKATKVANEINANLTSPVGSNTLQSSLHLQSSQVQLQQQGGNNPNNRPPVYHPQTASIGSGGMFPAISQQQQQQSSAHVINTTPSATFMGQNSSGNNGGGSHNISTSNMQHQQHMAYAPAVDTAMQSSHSQHQNRSVHHNPSLTNSFNPNIGGSNSNSTANSNVAMSSHSSPTSGIKSSSLSAKLLSGYSYPNSATTQTHQQMQEQRYTGNNIPLNNTPQSQAQPFQQQPPQQQQQVHPYSTQMTYTNNQGGSHSQQQQNRY